MLQLVTAANGTANQMGPQEAERFWREPASYAPYQRAFGPGIPKPQGERTKNLAAEQPAVYQDLKDRYLRWFAQATQ